MDQQVVCKRAQRAHRINDRSHLDEVGPSANQVRVCAFVAHGPEVRDARTGLADWSRPSVELPSGTFPQGW
jgi:hypothetical protein